MHYLITKKMNEDKKSLAQHLLNKGKLISDIAKTFNVHNATIYRLLNKEGN